MKTENWAESLRPTMLKYYYGQPSAVEDVSSFLEKGKIPPTILIHGPSGCGKTTLARIIARSLNGTLDYDYEEPNVANAGVDRIREIIDQSKYKPKNKFKIIALDEAHTLTSKSAPALLKTLEEPNKSTIWMLLTNHPEKFDAPMLGRMYKIGLVQPSEKAVIKILNRAAEKKGLKLPEKDASIIANYSQNEPRTAITLLQKWANSKDIDKVVSEISESEDKLSLKLLYLLYKQHGDEAVAELVNFTANKYNLVHSMQMHNRALIANSLGQFKYLTKNQQTVKDKLDKPFKVKRGMQIQSALGKIKDRITTVSIDNVSFLGEFYNVIYGD